MPNQSPCPSAALLARYAAVVRKTDKLERDNLRPNLLGVVGEIGSTTTVAKKLHREHKAYNAFARDAEEEFGDVLWYLTALGQRIGVDVPKECQKHWSAGHTRTRRRVSPRQRDQVLLALAIAAGRLLQAQNRPSALRSELATVAQSYIDAVHACGLNYSTILRGNMDKVTSRFLEPTRRSLPEFDAKEIADERLPRHFSVEFLERHDGRVWLRLNGVFIGDALTDNIADKDGYRFHDVFHFAYAAYLHWSPVTRALLKRKRKRDPTTDENEDGGRAIVVEEGISAFVFARAKELNFFSGHSTIAYDVLKSIQHFVKGYEVARCPLRQWERAILKGFEVFRLLKAQKRGLVVVDLPQRTIDFRPIKAPR